MANGKGLYNFTRINVPFASTHHVTIDCKVTTRRAEFLLMLVTFIAAGGWLFSKSALAEFLPHSFVALRFTLAGVVLAVIFYRQISSLNVHQAIRCTVVGIVLGLALQVWVIALQQTEFIGEGSFLVSLTVILVPLISWMFYGVRLTPALFVALIPAVLGLACLFLERSFVLESSILYFLLATVGFSLHLNMSVYYVRSIPPLALSAIQLTSAGLVSVLCTWAFESTDFMPMLQSVSATAWYWLLASSLIATSLRFALQTQALQHLEASHASMIFLAEPVFTTMLGALTLGERMSVKQLLGCLLIFTSLLIFRGLPLIKQHLQRKRSRA